VKLKSAFKKDAITVLDYRCGGDALLSAVVNDDRQSILPHRRLDIVCYSGIAGNLISLNQIIAEVTSEFCLVAGESFAPVTAAVLEGLQNAMILSGADIISCPVKFGDRIDGGFGTIEVDDRTVLVSAISEDTIHMGANQVLLCSYISPFFLVRTNMLRRLGGWNVHLGSGLEHDDLLMRAKAEKVVVGVWLGYQFSHLAWYAPPEKEQIKHADHFCNTWGVDTKLLKLQRGSEYEYETVFSKVPVRHHRSIALDSNKSDNVLFIAFNAAFIPHARLFLKSLKANWPGHPLLLISFSGTEEELSAIDLPKNSLVLQKSRYAQSWKKALESFRMNTFHGILSERLALWSSVFGEFQSILHLDVDVLLLDHLDDLFDSQDFMIFAEKSAEDIFLNRADNRLSALLSEDNLTASQPNSNAGVFLLPRKYRNDQALFDMIRLGSRYSMFLKMADQSIINLWMQSHGLEGRDGSVYNFQFRELASRKVPYSGAKLLHFNGISEPLRLRIMTEFDEILQLPGGKAIARELAVHYLASSNEPSKD
jgi:hypothetical protein